MERRKRFQIALAIYAVLGLAAWTTLSSEPISVGYVRLSVRSLTIAILVFFVLRTLLHWKAEHVRAGDEDRR